ncbi:hypothetical protein EI42_05008 [Thermosporothrix hazakensis]|uniref:HTH cro/C1-type domain-containing protein n=3 Tax=Thermosporothrix TaxID=768650 RepID=A0A326U018_THEHA|nr:hypothetical protein EI42_05008 [Thermosporothrix hazakensis]BBH89731.1 hypothetical protein KTC_44820 [Thermosporothrix sp. COM3]GCE47920.1 hypothetical protein KTH_27890 [Thermosporothrix hazakensis]
MALHSPENPISNREEIGEIIKKARKGKKWSAEFLGKLYGTAIKGKPVSSDAIYQIEKGEIPQDMKRRAVLARLLDIPPAALGLSGLQDEMLISPTKKVNLNGIEKLLMVYWEQGAKDPHKALKDLSGKIELLHRNVLYMTSPQKEYAKKLLCSCHMRVAYICGELGYHNKALDHLSKVVRLAKDEELDDLETIALYRKGEYLFDRRDLKPACQYLGAAYNKALSTPLPPHVIGRIMALYGLAQVRIARTQEGYKQGRKFIDKSEMLVREDQGPLETAALYTLANTRSFYLQMQGKGAIEAPVKNLQNAHQTLEIADELEEEKHPDKKRFNQYVVLNCNLLRSQAFFSQGYYEVATETAKEAVNNMFNMRTFVHLPTMKVLYEKLKESSYGNSEAVAELGVLILFNELVDIF